MISRKILDELRARVFAKQTVLAKIYAGNKDRNFQDYVRGWETAASAEDAQTTRLPFFREAENLMLKLYGKEVSGAALNQLKKVPLLSTIDHHGLFGHPFFVNANLIYSLRGQDFLICLPTAGISLNNNTSWPGCLLVTGRDGQLRRFSFFPDRQKTQAVLAAKSLVLQDALRVRERVKSAPFLADSQKKKLLPFIGEIFQDDILQAGDFTSQACRFSAKMWQKTFPSAPPLIYIPLELLAGNLLAREIFPQKNHILHRLFFTAEGWNLIEKYFQGSLGAFTNQHKGSFLFWGIDGKGRRIHLLRQGNTLAGRDFSAEAQAVPEFLRDRRLYPTSLACFLILLYYDFTCIGGFNQVNWLTDIGEKFSRLLSGAGQRRLAGRIGSAVTDNFAEGSLGLVPGSRGQAFKPAALDLWLEDSDQFSRYQERARRITLGESIDAELAEIYRVITPAPEREERLASLSSAEIANFLGLIAS